MKINTALLIEQFVNVIDSLNKGLRLTPEEQLFFREYFEREEIKKNELIIRIGDYEKYLYFAESGTLRYWIAQEYGDPDKEIIFWFSSPDELANSYFSLKENQPSLMHIQALIDYVIWKLSKLDLADLCQTSLNINKIAGIILEDTLCRKITRETLLLGPSAEAIHEDLITKEKKLVNNIPLKYLAPYIGVTPQRLGQIRRKVHQ